MDFAAQTSTVSDVTVLAVEGDIELSSAEEFRRRAAAAIASAQRRVVLDLSEVRFFDSAGLHVLDECESAARDRNLEFALVVGETRVRRLFELTGLDDRFDIFGLLDDAVRI